MLHFHSLWTRPMFETRQAQATQDLVFWDFEALTWLTSVLEIRRHSPIRLITDTRGRQFVLNTALDSIYNGGISTALDDIPDTIDPQIFWAAGKIYAWREIDGPCISVDTDAVLWQPITPTAPIVALHLENRAWGWYASNRQAFAPFGFDDPSWDWDLHPFNHGVLYIQDPEARRVWTEKAIGFMNEFSAQVRQLEQSGAENPPHTRDAMLFADQRLLVMCAQRLGLSMVPLTRLDETTGYLLRNPLYTHLWGSKLFYPYCAEARFAFCRHLVSYLLAHHPESQTILERWQLDQPHRVDAKLQWDQRELECSDRGKQRISLLESVEGAVWITDANLDVRRKATPGSLVLPGELLLAEPGAQYRLCGAAVKPG